jgi:hypothetical protein
VDAAPPDGDTSPEIERRQIDAWRRTSDAEKLALAMSMSTAVRRLALAGIRQRYPDASPREQFLRLAVVTLGEELARKAYPEIAQLDLS